MRFFKKRDSSEHRTMLVLRAASEEFTRSLTSIVGLDQLLENFTSKLKEILDSASVFVVLYEPITGSYLGRKAKGQNAGLLAEFTFSRSDHLIRWLNINKCPLHVDEDLEVMSFLSGRERGLLLKADTLLVVPFIVVNHLTGALFISRKVSRASYSPFETETLSTLSNHSALAIEHALMYQFQEDRLKRLFHADKLATVGELAAGAAHEIRNPLTSIRSTIQYLTKALPADKQQAASGIIEEVDRIDEVIKGLLSFSKTTTLNMGPLDLPEILEQTLLLLDPELRKYSIVVNRQYHPTDTRIVGDASQLKQLFLNILLNSIQAMPRGGTISLDLSGHPVGQMTGAGRESHVRIAVTDDGCGISQSDLPKVFDPFFTTKETGTGLGLSISYGIVNKHGGDITITSALEGPGKGTTVTIHLPKHSLRTEAGPG